MIFATDNNLKLLAEAETVFVDGAFHTYPEIFKSDLSTVHAFKNGQQFSLAYCLLLDKTCSSYQRTFILLKEKAEELCVSVHTNL